jgi:general secretion pathway protein G
MMAIVACAVVIVCVLLIVVIGSIVGVSYIRVDRKAKVSATLAHMSTLEDAVTRYALDVGALPTTQQGLGVLLHPPADILSREKWRGPYLSNPSLPLDPWNGEYQYEQLSDEQFRIWSNSQDGIPGTPDDISTTP